MLGGDTQDFLAYHLGCLVHGIAGDYGATARKGTGAPIKLIRVAGHHIDVTDINTEAISGDLRKTGEMALALRADAGHDAHFAVRLHLHFRAFIGTDAGALDVASDGNAEVASLGAQPRLFILDEALVVDESEHPVQRSFIIAAVIFERREILIDNLVVVRERVRRNEVAASDLDAIDSQLTSGEIHQPLNDEHTVLATGATIGRDGR